LGLGVLHTDVNPAVRRGGLSRGGRNRSRHCKKGKDHAWGSKLHRSYLLSVVVLDILRAAPRKCFTDYDLAFYRAERIKAKPSASVWSERARGGRISPGKTCSPRRDSA